MKKILLSTVCGLMFTATAPLAQSMVSEELSTRILNTSMGTSSLTENDVLFRRTYKEIEYSYKHHDTALGILYYILGDAAFARVDRQGVMSSYVDVDNDGIYEFVIRNTSDFTTRGYKTYVVKHIKDQEFSVLFTDYVSEIRSGVHPDTNAPTLQVKSYTRTYSEYSLKDGLKFVLSDANFVKIADFQSINTLPIDNQNWIAQSLTDVSGSIFYNLFRNTANIEIGEITKFATADMNGDGDDEIFLTFKSSRICDDDNYCTIYVFDGSTKEFRLELKGYTDKLKLGKQVSYGLNWITFEHEDGRNRSLKYTNKAKFVEF